MSKIVASRNKVQRRLTNSQYYIEGFDTQCPTLDDDDSFSSCYSFVSLFDCRARANALDTRAAFPAGSTLCDLRGNQLYNDLTESSGPSPFKIPSACLPGPGTTKDECSTIARFALKK